MVTECSCVASGTDADKAVILRHAGGAIAAGHGRAGVSDLTSHTSEALSALTREISHQVRAGAIVKAGICGTIINIAFTKRAIKAILTEALEFIHLVDTHSIVLTCHISTLIDLPRTRNSLKTGSTRAAKPAKELLTSAVVQTWEGHALKYIHLTSWSSKAVSTSTQKSVYCICTRPSILTG